MQAWQSYTHPDDDSADGPSPACSSSGNSPHAARKEKGGVPGREPRLADQLQFMAETMYDFNREIARYLREDLGCKQLINAGNWQTVDELYSTTPSAGATRPTRSSARTITSAASTRD